jgi:tRNA(adenine34) deaminase
LKNKIPVGVPGFGLAVYPIFIAKSTIYMQPGSNEQFMQQALKEAQLAFQKEEVPVGAIIVMEGRIIARGHNQVELLKDPTAHAEIIALTSAFNFLGSKYLPDATLYVTIEPCLMCAGALYWSKIGRIVYGAEDEKNGYRKTAGTNWPFHPKTELVSGILKEDCAKLMKDFFRAKR